MISIYKQAALLVKSNLEVEGSVTIVLCEDVLEFYSRISSGGWVQIRGNNNTVSVECPISGSVMIIKGFDSCTAEEIAGYCSDNYLGIAINLPDSKAELLEVMRGCATSKNSSVVEVRSVEVAEDIKPVPSIAEFADTCCGTVPTDQQKEIFNAIQSENSRVSVSSGYGVGVSRSIAIAALWNLVSHNGSRTFISGIGQSDRYFDIVWKEVANILSQSTGLTVTMDSDRIYIDGHRDTWFIRKLGCPAYEVLDDYEPEGFEDDNTLVIIESAQDLSEKAFRGIGNLDNGRIALFGRPNELIDNPFYHTHHVLSKINGGEWDSMILSSEDSSLVHKDFIKEMKIDRSYIDYKRNLLGEFPIKGEGICND